MGESKGVLVQREQREEDIARRLVGRDRCHGQAGHAEAEGSPLHCERGAHHWEGPHARRGRGSESNLRRGTKRRLIRPACSRLPVEVREQL